MCWAKGTFVGLQEIGWMEGCVSFVLGIRTQASAYMHACNVHFNFKKRKVALDLVRAQGSIEKTAFSKGCGVD